MTPDNFEFRTGVIKPVECVKEGWALIKDQYWLFFGISLVGLLIGGVVPIVLLGPMMVGIFICIFCRMRREPVEFGMLFKGFDHFVQGLIVAVLKIVPIIILMIPFYIIMFAVMFITMPLGQATPDESSRFMFTFFGFEMVFAVVVITVSILIETFFMFAFPLVADRNLPGFDAVKLGLRAVKANFGGVLGLMLLNALLGFVGVLCCVVGLYLYLPVSFASYAIAYRRVFPEVSQNFVSPPPPPASWAA